MAENDNIPIKVVLRKNDTGEILEYYDSALEDENGQPALYIWEEGNYSCDCNRTLFWSRAKKIEPSEIIYCSEGKFSVNIYSMGDKLLYREFRHSQFD